VKNVRHRRPVGTTAILPTAISILPTWIAVTVGTTAILPTEMAVTVGRRTIFPGMTAILPTGIAVTVGKRAILPTGIAVTVGTMAIYRSPPAEGLAARRRRRLAQRLRRFQYPGRRRVCITVRTSTLVASTGYRTAYGRAGGVDAARRARPPDPASAPRRCRRWPGRRAARSDRRPPDRAASTSGTPPVPPAPPRV
jgi:hypothetical protein